MQLRAFCFVPACFCGVCFCLCVAHSVHADPKANARKEIQAAYDRYADAIAKGDVDTAMRVKASGYINITVNGDVQQASDQEMRQHFARISEPPNKRINKFRILSVELHGNEAIVTDVNHLDGVRLDRNTGQLVPIHIVESDRDFWVKANGQWRWKRSRALTHEGS